MSALLDAATAYAQRGWPVLWIRSRAKEPLTRHGVADATTDVAKIRRWHKRWPDANLAIATGAPGPQVLDVDDPERAGEMLERLRALDPPTAAAARGPHLYFAGLDRATVALGFGELRGLGSYIVCPPSVHPSGRDYVWTYAPNGTLLPEVPDFLVAQRSAGAGSGDFRLEGMIEHGRRHEALRDAAVRFMRGGYTDVVTIERMLEVFFNANCDPNPPPRKGEFRSIAEWAAKTRIAQRERLLEDEPPAKQSKAKRVSGLERPPGRDATLREHRDYVKTAMGLPVNVDVRDVKRYAGAGRLKIVLSNGVWVTFAGEDDVAKRGLWARTVTRETHGDAHPVLVNDWEGLQVLRSLCLLANVPARQREEEMLRDAVDDMLAIAEPITGLDLSTYAGRYDAVMRCRARPSWDPRNRELRPVAIVDGAGRRYVRAGELFTWLSHRSIRLLHAELQGRMAEFGAEQVSIEGRESPRPDGGTRRKARMVLYRLADELADEPEG